MTEFWKFFRLEKQLPKFDPREVTQIDVARLPTCGVDSFWIVLFAGSKKLAEISDSSSAYKDFRNEVLKYWPETEKLMDVVFCGPPSLEERATIWKQRESY